MYQPDSWATSLALALIFSALPKVAMAQLRLTATGGGANYVGLQAPSAVVSSFTWLLPSADGGANQCLATNGSGTLIRRTSGGTGYSLDANDGSPTNALYVDAAGFVGIGVTSPLLKLDVQDAGQAAVRAATISGGSL